MALVPGFSNHHIISHRSIKPSITFPLARPTTANIHAICQYSNQRPRYSKNMLPRSGFGYLHRQGSAVNRLESWYTVCCADGTKDDELTLCCAQQAVRAPYNAQKIFAIPKTTYL